MKKLLIVLIFVLTLSGCNLLNPTPTVVDYSYNLFDGQDTVEINSEWIDAGAVMYFDGNSTGPTASGSVNTSQLGLYKIQYKHTYDGTEYVIDRYVIVVDDTAPVLTLNPGVDTVTLGEEWTDEGITVVDNSLEALTYITTGEVDNTTVGRYIITYTATDSSGNESIIERIVNIVSWNFWRIKNIRRKSVDFRNDIESNQKLI